MNRIEMESQVPGDGVLKLMIPLGAEEARKKVKVTIEPISTEEMTQDQ
jgi:hypothetical protein